MKMIRGYPEDMRKSIDNVLTIFTQITILNINEIFLGELTKVIMYPMKLQMLLKLIQW
ncbi:MAG: hypothetical protein ACTSPF_13915 [Candidatus Heimdallarchaeaceae archaeon]